MNEGLLWFCKDPTQTMADIIDAAKERHLAKFGRQPNTCYVNPADFDGRTDRVNGVRILAAKNTLRYHYLIGVDGAQP
jgi:hypothetical protein